ncbi:uncharacterized protein AB675_42 [Cyphellophora attinorum]|uniref:Uncharacterized protein n=1 Tax=Cyphellophora attinorum TaxID=1664694 RepID=A0A0N1HKD8_9EURO|nr:uncharacterized protein AB675_42 [Phialophora attinorum]KPI34687.1 hypothetical protein AB675_42 [Phialophora attinorum]
MVGRFGQATTYSFASGVSYKRHGSRASDLSICRLRDQPQLLMHLINGDETARRAPIVFTLTEPSSFDLIRARHLLRMLPHLRQLGHRQDYDADESPGADEICDTNETIGTIKTYNVEARGFGAGESYDGHKSRNTSNFGNAHKTAQLSTEAPPKSRGRAAGLMENRAGNEEDGQTKGSAQRLAISIENQDFDTAAILMP